MLSVSRLARLSKLSAIRGHAQLASPAFTCLNQRRCLNIDIFKPIIGNIVAKPQTASIRCLGTSTDMDEVDKSISRELNERVSIRSLMSGLERALDRFDERSQKAEKVIERDFVRTFDYLTKVVDQLHAMKELDSNDVRVNLSLASAILLRCCGKLMLDTPKQVRELLAGNLWQFLKEKKIPLDISHYNSLLRVLNENGTVFDPQKFLTEIAEANLTPDRVTYQRLIHQYCSQGDVSGATNLLEKMKDLNMELNEMTFASLIMGYGKQENPPTASEMFDLMKSNGVEPGNCSYAATIVCLASMLDKPEQATKAAEELEKVHKLVASEDIQFSAHEMTDIFEALNPHKDNPAVAKLFSYLLDSPQGNINSRSRIYGVLIKLGCFEEVSKLYWMLKPSERAIRTGNVGIFYIRLLATLNNIPIEHVMNEASKFKEVGYNSKVYHYLYYMAAEIGNLNMVRAALQKIGEEETIKCQYYWPLLAQAKDQSEIIDVLKKDLNPKMDTNDLIDTFSQWVWPKFASDTLKLFELNKNELHYDSNLLMASFFNYSVQEDKVADAIKFISEAPEDIINIVPTENRDEEIPEGDSLMNLSRTVVPERGTLIGRLLNQIAEQTKDSALVMKIYNLCQVPGQKVTSRSSTPIIKVYLANDDFKSALDMFTKIASEHRITPGKSDLIKYCLEKKDADSLQKIMNISTDIHGEANALLDLASCCLQCGKTKQAQKIFASPGFRVNPTRVYETAILLSRNVNINVVENFVHLCRDMYDVNQEKLYQILIDTYDRTSNGKRALDLWNRMQEEEFQPSKKCLSMIARVLEKNNISVPFQKPKGIETRSVREHSRD